MAEKNLAQHIDKISYAVAGAVGIVLLVLPLVVGGNISETRTSVNVAASELRQKKRTQDFPDPPKRTLRKEIQGHWNPGTGSVENPTWITEAAPCLLKKAKSVEKRPGTHAPGVITEISCHRDAAKKQVYLTIKGAMGEGNEFVVIETVQLSRSVGDAGSFEPLGPGWSGDFEYQDYDVKAGETYTYKFTTAARKDPAAPSNIEGPDVPKQDSGEMDPTPPIPYDFSVKVKQTFPAKELGQQPTVMADFYYWDYKRGEKRKVRQPRGGFPNKTTIASRYEIFRIDPGKRSIQIRDRLARNKKSEISRKDTPFPIDLWEPISGVVEEKADPEAEEAAEVEPVKEAKSAARPPSKSGTPKPRPSRRGFK